MNYKEEIEGVAVYETEKREFKFSFFSSKENKGITSTSISGNIKTLQLNKKILDFKTQQGFVESLVVLYHELKHIDQWKEIRNKDCDIQTTMELLSRTNNDSFYWANYKNMLYELSAEKAGLIGAHIYLEENHPEIDASRAIKNYIENQIKNNDARYKGKAFELCFDIDEIVEEFNNVICQAQAQPLCIPYTYEQYEEKTYNEDCYKMILEIGYNETKEIFALLSSHYNQLKFLASYTLKAHPDYRNFLKNKEIKNLNFENYVRAYDLVQKSKEFMSPLSVMTTHTDRTNKYLSKVNELNNLKISREMTER